MWNLLVKLPRFFLSIKNAVSVENEYAVHWRTL